MITWLSTEKSQGHIFIRDTRRNSLGMGVATEKRRYIETSSFIGLAHSHHDLLISRQSVITMLSHEKNNMVQNKYVFEKLAMCVIVDHGCEKQSHV